MGVKELLPLSSRTALIRSNLGHHDFAQLTVSWVLPPRLYLLSVVVQSIWNRFAGFPQLDNSLESNRQVCQRMLLVNI